MAGTALDLVEISQSSDGRPDRIGLLVGDRLVLTHTVGPAPRVRLAGSAESFGAAVVWRSMDLALLEVDAGWSRPAPRPYRWGLVTGRDSWLEAVVVTPATTGSPGAGGQETAIEVNNLAVSPGGQWRARIRPTGDMTPALPAAGAPVFSGEFLVGVVTPPEDGSGLAVVPLAPLAADDGCQRAVQRSGRPLRPEPVELARSLRPWLPEYSWLPAALLRPEFEVIPFVGRDAIVDELTRWCLSAVRHSAKLLTGPVGSGRRRLARHLADQLRARGWAVGELASVVRSGWTDAVQRSRKPILLILDDVPGRGEQLRDLARALAAEEADVPVRVLLLGEDDGDWWSRLRDSAPEVRALCRPAPELLAELDPLSGRDQFASDAARTFAAIPRLGAGGALVWPRPHVERPGRALALQLDALAGVVSTASADIAGNTSEEIVLAAERRGWERQSAQLRTAGSAWSDGLFAALLFGAATETSARETLQAVPGLADLPAAELGDLARWIRWLYPPGDPASAYWGTLYPASVLALFVGERCAESALLETILPTVERDQARRALGLILSAARILPETGLSDRLRRIVARHTGALAPELVSVAAGDRDGLALLSSLVADDDTDLPDTVCEDMLKRFPVPAGHMSTVELALRARLIDVYGASVEAGLSHHRASLAAQLNLYAAALASAGELDRAVEESRRAVAEYESLSSVLPNANAFATPTADSRRLRARLLAEQGRLDDAAGEAERAATVYRDEAAVDPSLRGRHADTLELVAQLWRRAGDQAREREALTRAADVRRDLAASPRGDQDNVERLVATLSRHADLLWTDGDLANRHEAVRYARRLHRARPVTYRHLLLSCLQALSDDQFRRGNIEAGLDVLGSTMSLRRHDADEYPDQGLPLLVAAAQHLSQRLADAGRTQEALDAARDALAAAERLGQRSPGGARAELAAAQNIVGLRLARLGRWDEAAVWFRRSADGYTQLGGTGPLLAGTLTNLSAALAETGAHVAAEESAARAIANLPRDGEPDIAVLAAALTNQAAARLAQGRADDSVPPARRAVELHGSVPTPDQGRSLAVLRDALLAARRLPDATDVAERVVATYAGLGPEFRAEHAVAVGQLARCLLAQRRWGEAIRVAREGQSMWSGAADPDAEAELAGLALVLCDALRGAGRPAEAAEAAQDAVRRYRAIDDDDFDRAAGLVDALDRADELAVRNDVRAAVTAAQEAVDRRVPLARGLGGDPDQVVRLIAALRRLARRHEAAAQPREALGAARRALTESQRLMDMTVAEAPAEVAASLRELAKYLARAGQDREADATAMQAVEAYRALADGDPSYLRPLAEVGIDLSRQRLTSGNPLGARVAAREATAAAERIAGPAERDLLLLDRARVQLDHCQARLGEDDERLAPAQTRVTMWRALAAEDPRHRANLGLALRSLAGVPARRSLELRRAAATEAVTIFEDLARQDQAFQEELLASRRTLADLGRWRIILGRVQRQPA